MTQKVLNRQVWANSVNPDQTAPEGLLFSRHSLAAIHNVKILGYLQQFFRTHVQNCSDIYGKIQQYIEQQFFVCDWFGIVVVLLFW